MLNRLHDILLYIVHSILLIVGHLLSTSVLYSKHYLFIFCSFMFCDVYLRLESTLDGDSWIRQDAVEGSSPNKSETWKWISFTPWEGTLAV